MPIDAAALLPTLHPLEVKVLRAFEGRESLTPEEAAALGVEEAQARTALEWLAAKGVLKVAGETRSATVSLTEIGRRFAESGLPEVRVLEALRSGPKTNKAMEAELGLEADEVGTAAGRLKGMKAIVMTPAGWAGPSDGSAPLADLSAVHRTRDLLARLLREGPAPLGALSPEERKIVEEGSRKRGARKGPFQVAERALRRYAPVPQAGPLIEMSARGTASDEVSVLTPEMLKDGSWRTKRFRRYNLSLAPPRKVVGRKNAYREYLDLIQRKLVALGFEEMRGPLVETEFWNMDALFMPQTHPARDIHDVYFVKDPPAARTLPEPYATHVAEAHERGGGTGSRGWGGVFDRERTRRLVLRSQGTALSARALREAKVPGKYFAIARCFRFDTVDATHAPDFFQVEGIVLDERIHFGHLLGLLKLFALEVAKAPECRFVPAYFPFTEPSVEVHMRHPALGWMELGGAGIFRPEVTEPQGVKVPVIAWGLGIDRMAMVALGIQDIRELFSAGLDAMRARRLGALE